MADHSAISSWSELPWDLLDRILQHLELPEALSVASVCAPWRSAAAASGVPRAGTPWLVSQYRAVRRREKTAESESEGSEFRNLLGTGKTYTVSLPQGRRDLSWCGASHGWLVAYDDLFNLLLYNPFTFSMIPLLPIASLGLLSPHLRKLGCQLYEKVALSCDPSHGVGDCIAMVIYDNNKVSFARIAGESSWGLFSTTRETDTYADCVHHDGRFYAVTMQGAVETWDLDEGTKNGPNKHVIVARDGLCDSILTRFLVSTPWGGLLQIRVLQRTRRHRRTKVEVLQINVAKHKLVKLSPATAFRGHAVFVGFNESACLDAREFPELRPNCVYFTTPGWIQEKEFGLEDRSVVYDLESQTCKDVLARPYKDSELRPRKVWFVPNI